MALYIKPPMGSISYDKLHGFVMKRLAFLYFLKDHTVEEINKLIEREALARNSECLIEGTVIDKISHFTLRFLCASDFMLQEFFIENETKLFNYRILFCDFTKILEMLQKASEQSRNILFGNNFVIESYKKFFKSLIFITEELQHATQEEKKFIKVPFSVGLEFVKNRQYPLHLGYVSLPLTEIKSLTVYLFKELVVEGLNQTRASVSIKELEDSRLQYMKDKIKKWLLLKLRPLKISGKKLAKGYNLRDENKKFPLCMSNLHELLLKHHRLRHISRVQYTLFLKEIGVPSADVIQLFKEQYSVPLVQTHKKSHVHCSHNWTESNKKYIYSIEHLYGMRGACKNYKAYNCLSLQNSCDFENGCPFANFDDQHLQSALEKQNLQVHDIEDIISLAKKKDYQEACGSYLLYKINAHLKRKRMNYLSNNESSKSTNACLDSLKFIQTNTSIKFSSEDHLHIPTLPQKISSPVDFYSIFSSVTDGYLLTH